MSILDIFGTNLSRGLKYLRVKNWEIQSLQLPNGASSTTGLIDDAAAVSIPYTDFSLGFTISNLSKAALIFLGFRSTVVTTNTMRSRATAKLLDTTTIRMFGDSIADGYTHQFLVVELEGDCEIKRGNMSMDLLTLANSKSSAALGVNSRFTNKMELNGGNYMKASSSNGLFLPSMKYDRATDKIVMNIGDHTAYGGTEYTVQSFNVLAW